MTLQFKDWREIRAHMEEVHDCARRQAEEQEFNSRRDDHRRKLRESSEWALEYDLFWLECFMSTMKERIEP